MEKRILKNQKDLNEDLKYNLTDLNKIKGEKLINLEIRNNKPLKQFILSFRTLNQSENVQTHDVYITAENISFVKQNSELDNVFITVKFEDIIGKKLVEYEDWHTENLADTGNLTGPVHNLTLTFEDGYSIEILNYQ